MNLTFELLKEQGVFGSLDEFRTFLTTGSKQSVSVPNEIALSFFLKDDEIKKEKIMSKSYYDLAYSSLKGYTKEELYSISNNSKIRRDAFVPHTFVLSKDSYNPARIRYNSIRFDGLLFIDIADNNFYIKVKESFNKEKNCIFYTEID